MKKFLKIFLKTSIVLCLLFIILYGLTASPLATYIFGRTRFIDINFPIEHYSSESPEVVNVLSKNKINSIVESMRDSILFVEDPFPGVEQLIDFSEQQKRVYYFGYYSTLPGIDYQKAWKINYGSATEIPFEEYLKAWESPLSPDLPYAVYSIHFWAMDYRSLLSITVCKKYNYEFLNFERPWYVDAWLFNETFSGNWKLKEVVNDVSYFRPSR